LRAQTLTAHGGPENFRLSELPIPATDPGFVLVRIAAASVNQLDVKIRQGLPVGPPLPAVLGCDMAGTVVGVGAGVVGFAPGDTVYGLVGGVKGHGGTYAEFIHVDARLLSPAPRTMSLHDAAALPLVGLTAWEALQVARVDHKDHVLVHGGTGGVGHVGVQLAKAFGARVATTVDSAEAAALARSLGADATIEFRSEGVAEYVDRLTGGRGFDVVFDTIGGPNLPNSLAATAAGGRVVTTDGRTTLDISPMHGKALTLSVVFVMRPLLTGTGLDGHGQGLRRIARLVDDGMLRPLVDPMSFTLDTVADAHRYLGSGKARGKVVVDVELRHEAAG
jgi:NADPH2:quinone reductase